MELLFLGTGAGIPSKERNVTAIALSLLQEINSIWLFDCGEATQHQILHTSIKPRKVNKIFITHLHGDHIFGLPGFLSSRSFQGGNEELIIYGPKGIKDYVKTSLELSASHLTYPLSFVEVEEGQIVDEEHFEVHARKLDHGIDSYGYRIIEKNKPGELLVSKLVEMNVMPGPIYKQIKENSMVTLEDGTIIYRENFIGPEKKGRIVTILGDTRYQKEHQEFVADSDVLVHEATFEHEKANLAYEYFHSTTTQAATLANNSNVIRLILTHISSRYQKDNNQKLLEEAKKIFPNTSVATDFTNIIIE
ncbi:ribonuclease Z [Oceanobacillus halophilus]|uniref:Ribonuclease Z n=1 Tax=Oceanobacillus halophilus TaxID=930130 RepID=A0A495ACR0_9BACI|nr:ribonuclease Z [Oceanobacillus halophilus]RKQ37728.1 ribonuclease Z [Oceanobacillus halophilus]